MDRHSTPPASALQSAMGALALASMVLIGLMVVGSIWYGPQKREQNPVTAAGPSTEPVRTDQDFSVPRLAFSETLNLSGSLSAEDVPLDLRTQKNTTEVSVPVRIEYQRPLATPVASRSEEVASLPEPFPDVPTPEFGNDEWRSISTSPVVMEGKSQTDVIRDEQKQPAKVPQVLPSEVFPAEVVGNLPAPDAFDSIPDVPLVTSRDPKGNFPHDPFAESLKTGEPPWLKLEERLNSVEQKMLQSLLEQESRQRKQIDNLEALWRASQEKPATSEPVVVAQPSSIEIIRWTVSAPPTPPIRSGGVTPLTFSDAVSGANGRPAVQPAVVEIKRQAAGPDRYTLRLQDAELARVLPQLADLAGLRLETPADLSGRVNLDIHQVTLPQAMESLLGNSPYRIVSRSGTLQIQARHPDSPAVR